LTAISTTIHHFNQTQIASFVATNPRNHEVGVGESIHHGVPCRRVGYGGTIRPDPHPKKIPKADLLVGLGFVGFST